jgi:hypothetical protein
VPAPHLQHVLWLGGMSGVGKTTAARAIAREYDVALYSLDAHAYDHAARADSDRHPALMSFSTLSPDELWVTPSPEAIAERFWQASREQFELVVEDLLALPADAPIIADGPQLVPEVVAPVLRSREHALFVVADASLQRELVTNRGSLTYAATADADRARENRLERDRILAERVRADAAAHRLAVAAVAHLADTRQRIEQHFGEPLRQWLARGDRGDVAARRRRENDARVRQWRLHAEHFPAAADVEAEFACECGAYGCTVIVTRTLGEAESERANGRPLVAHATS